MYSCRAIQDSMGSIYDIMDAFRTVRPLIDIPDAWRMCFAETPEASCWYPAHISCQVCRIRHTCSSCLRLATGYI